MSFSTPALILIAIAVIFIIGDKNAKVNAFTGVSKIILQKQQQQQQQQQQFQTQQRNVDALTLSSSFPCPAARTTNNRQSSLSARIYGVDGTVVNDDEFENKDTGALGGGNGEIIESLQDAIGDRSVWTRIACAFASAPHNQLTPELVRNAKLLRVGTTGIDVAVAVPASMGSPSADQLVQVLVTVGYPQSWSFEKSKGDDDEEQLRMLVQQIRILDGHATDRLSQRTAGIAAARHDPFYYEKMVVEQQWMERLQEEADESDSLPDWWKTIAPQSSPLELVDECKLLKNLLNEDEFEDELRALFVKYSDANVAVVRAAVSSIGSSGLYLKGRIVAAKEDEPSETLSAVAVPYVRGTIDTNRIEFPTANELREAVLVLVESVPPMPKPPAAKETSKTAEEFTPFNEQVVAVVTEAEERAKTKPGVSDSHSEEEDEKDDDVEAEPVAAAAKMDEPPMKEVEDERDEDVPIPSTSTGRTYYRRKSPNEEAKLSEKYAAIEDLGERAYTILRDLNMI